MAAFARSVFVRNFMFGRGGGAVRAAITLAQVHFAHATFVRAFVLGLFDNHIALSEFGRFRLFSLTR